MVGNVHLPGRAWTWRSDGEALLAVLLREGLVGSLRDPLVRTPDSYFRSALELATRWRRRTVAGTVGCPRCQRVLHRGKLRFFRRLRELVHPVPESRPGSVGPLPI